MTPEHWRKVEEIFLAASERLPAEREAFLTQICDGDDELRTEISSLLAHDAEEEFFEGAVRDGAKAFAQTALEEVIGQRIGAYRLTGLIGQGGMGAVYSAVRDDDQYQQQVAIKIVKRGMDTSLVLRRFWRERQILASLNHPHIARLLDGGTTADGLPYFVMEFIEGRPITEYGEAKQVSMQDRLKLFRQVCSAVQFAHQNLIVHRDIKPSNILVTQDGAPKLLDFGIAKLLSPETAQSATRTAAGLRMMTPHYASPEQVCGLPITTAADIYSLGAVLYELLTGQPAHRFKNYTPAEIEQTVCQTAIEKPSEAVARLSGAPARRRKQLAGDLDNIVLMALRKEPERRYQSAEQFSEDLRRYLTGLPVSARKDILTYRAGKFARRHKVGIAAVALVILSLTGGMAASLYQTRRAEYQSQRAERRFQQVRKLANTFLFDFHDKIQSLPGSTEARELVIKTALEYLDSLAQEAEGDPAFQLELAQAYKKTGDVQGDGRYASLGKNDAAQQSYRKALNLLQPLVAKDRNNLQALRTLAMCYVELGDMQTLSGNTAGGIEALSQALRVAEALDTRKTSEQQDLSLQVRACQLLGEAQWKARDINAALHSYRRAKQLNERWVKEFPSDQALHGLALSFTRLGVAQAELGDLTGTIDSYSQAKPIRESLVKNYPLNARYRREMKAFHNWFGNFLGNPLFLNQGDKAAALEHYRLGLAVAEEMAAADPKNAQAQYDLAVSYEKMGDILAESDPAQGVAFYRKALAETQALAQATPGDFMYLRRQALHLRGLATCLRRLGDRRGALQHLRQTLETLQALAAKQPANAEIKADLHATFSGLGDLTLATGDFTAAAEHFNQALTLAETAATARPSDLYARWRLADSYAGLARLREATAADAKTPLEQRRAQHNEACAWRRKALAVWDGWTQYGVSSAFNTTKREQAARALAQCEAVSATSAAAVAQPQR